MSIIVRPQLRPLTIGLLSLVTLLPATVDAQLLPVVEEGDVTASLEAWADGFPVNTWVNNAGNEFRFGPTDLVPIPGLAGSLAVSTHGGLAFIVSPTGQIQETPLLDFNSAASATHSPGFAATPIQGFTSIAYHPDFANRNSPGYGRFYTLESERVSAAPVVDFADSIVGARHHHEVVYEYTVSDPTLTVCDVDCAQHKRALMRIEQPGLHHNLGDLIFGKDQLLYISSGDGNNAGNQPDIAISDNSQLLTNVFGKILRIDPLGSNSANGMYGIPDDNPFADGPGGVVDEIYAYGLRNPYRLALDLATDQLYTSETGQLNIESVYRIQSGANYGWNLLEGSFLYDKGDQATVVRDEDTNGNGIGDFAEQNGFQRPVLEFDHQSGVAIIGSVLYRGRAFPELVGKFIFADHLGKLFYGDPDTGLINEFRLTDDSSAIPSRVFSINEDADGELYVLGVSGKGEAADGVILRLRPDPRRGDFDQDGDLDVVDVDTLVEAIRAGDEREQFDLNRDDLLDRTDLEYWVRELKRTYFGDADLNGEFDSSDLIQVMQRGEYDDEIPLNSTWSEGDWDLDLEFSSSDLVAAFKDAGYDQGPRPAQAIPEPSGLALLLIGLVVFLLRVR